VAEYLKVFEGVIPERIQCDNGSEFRTEVVYSWAYEHSVKLDFTLSGKHLNNPFDESLMKN